MIRKQSYRLFFLLLSVFTLSIPAYASSEVNIKQFLNLVTGSEQEQHKALKTIGDKWEKEHETSYTVMLLESMSFIRDQEMLYSTIELLQFKTKQQFKYDINGWFKWVWSQTYKPHSHYAEFKAKLYQNIDPIFAEYFDSKYKSIIRLDEIRWGGVRQDGIPPLRQPKMINAKQAGYLDESDIVFGIEINGDIRAYPKRVLAWHEMFVDNIGGTSIAGVYCTLCGTVIIYDTTIENKTYNIGTSGFLYRSNKLMYDKKTQSLWSTFAGSPVVGTLVGQGIKLPHRYVVTTTWGEWKKRHPESKVLSLNTGYSRNYNEGVAYREYFSSDKLMFNVPKLDTRLKNKDEIIGLILNQHPNKPLAISVNYLANNPLYHDKIADQSFVALTDKSGAIRIYDNKNTIFEKWDQENTAIDEHGVVWILSEAKLTNNKGENLYRLPANRAFWFGWFSAYQNTRLVL